MNWSWCNRSVKLFGGWVFFCCCFVGFGFFLCVFFFYTSSHNYKEKHGLKVIVSVLIFLQTCFHKRKALPIYTTYTNFTWKGRQLCYAIYSSDFFFLFDAIYASHFNSAPSAGTMLSSIIWAKSQKKKNYHHPRQTWQGTQYLSQFLHYVKKDLCNCWKA